LESSEALWQLMGEEMIRAARTTGVIGFSILDLGEGKEYSHLGDTVFPTASTIKIPILVALAHQVFRGERAWDQRVPVPRARAGGSGMLQWLQHVEELSVWDLASLMIAISDNVATNICIDMVTMEAVNRLLDDLGLSRVRLRRKMMDPEAVARGDENVATPTQLTRLMSKLHYQVEIPEPVCHDVLAILRLPKQGPFTEALPVEVPRANKPGGLPGASIDSGIVYLPRRPYALTVMGTFLEEDRCPAMRGVVRTAHRYMKLLDESRGYGRR